MQPDLPSRPGIALELIETDPYPSDVLTLRMKSLRAGLSEHLASLGLTSLAHNGHLPLPDKDTIRANHAIQRRNWIARELKALSPQLSRLSAHFADGSEVIPERIDPELQVVDAEGETGALFRLASLLWSVPVSRGFGRRIRFLVRDRSNGKLVGLFALGDPVFNLRDRDQWIGWSVRDREQRLVHVMDAYVVGAVPPYSQLLGGKLVASLMGSKEVSEVFEEKYSDRRGIISRSVKPARLVLITVTSALGRSSIYNRLRLKDLVSLERVGRTQGWGHFQVSDELFEQMREVLEIHGHPYASGHQFGSGPNWRMRVVRESLRLCGLDQNLLRHGIPREVFAMPLFRDWRAYLLGGDAVVPGPRPTSKEISAAARDRWVIPRAQRKPEFACWRRSDTVRMFNQSFEHCPQSSAEVIQLPIHASLSEVRAQH